jgi:hypothetical protein
MLLERDRLGYGLGRGRIYPGVSMILDRQDRNRRLRGRVSIEEPVVRHDGGDTSTRRSPKRGNKVIAPSTVSNTSGRGTIE